MHALQPLQLLVECLGHGLAPFLGLRFFLQLVQVQLGRIAQLVLDGLHLLLQEILALLLVDALLGLVLYAQLEVDELRFLVEQFEQLVAALHQHVLFEQGLLVLHVEGHVGTYVIDEEHGVFDVADGEHRLGRHRARLGDDARGEVLDG